ncbi:DUF3017 domain-containing protein [Cellulomonas sp. P22]|uniref:DUF3017 domain-containing protein n=1 Tax=Cellulomonas sp. P22 TaxID=3373189 RepID=UPI0037BD06D3
MERREGAQGPAGEPGASDPQQAARQPRWPSLNPPRPDPVAGAAAEPAAAPQTEDEVPPEEQELDPRQIARASLAAGRNLSLWWVSAGVVVSALVAVAAGISWGGLVLSVVLVACAVARSVAPGQHPAALAVRTRFIDVTLLVGLAFTIGVLSQVVPTG